MFSATFRYALISLLEIAGSEDGVNTAVIAQRHNIPGTYLANVLRDLRRLGTGEDGDGDPEQHGQPPRP